MNQNLNEYDRFESNLQHILQNHESPFDPNDWALMEEKLRQKNGGIVPFLQKYKWLFTATMLLMFTSIWQLKHWYNTAPTYDINKKTISPNHNGIAPNKNDITMPATNLTQNPTTKSVIQENNSKPKTITNPSHADTPLSSTQRHKNTNQHRPQKHNNHIPAIDEKANNNLTTNLTNAPINPNTPINLINDLVAAKAKNPTSDNEHIAQKSINLQHTNDLPNNKIEELNNENQPNTAQKQTDNLNTTSEIEINQEQAVKTPTSLLADKQGNNLAKKITATKKPKNKFTAFYAMPFFSIDGNFVNARPLRLGYSTGLSLNYQFHRNFSLETGIAYTQKNYQMTTVFENYLPTFPEQYRIEEAKMNFVEIPFLFKFHLPTYSDECLPYIGLGNSILMPISKHYIYNKIVPVPSIEQSLPSDTIYLNAAAPSSNDENLETLWRNVHLKAGASFKLTKKLRLNIESQFKASLDKVQLVNNNPIIEKNKEQYNLFSFGIQTGLSYRF